MKLFDVLYTNKDYDGRALISSNNANACNFILQSQGKLGNSYKVTSILDVGESSFPEILVSEYYSKRVDGKQSTFNIKDVYNNMDFTKFSEGQIASLRDLLNIPETPDYTDKFEEIQESIQDLSDADVDTNKKVDTNSKNIDSIKTSVSNIQKNYGTRITTNENNIKRHTTSINNINDRLNNQDDSKEIFLTTKNFFNIGNTKPDDSPVLENFSDIFHPYTYIDGEWYNPFLLELNKYTDANYSLEPAKVICKMSRFCTIENLNEYSINSIYNGKNPFEVTELDNFNQFHKMICRFAKKIGKTNNTVHFFVLNIKFSNCHNGRFYKYEPIYDKDGYCIYYIHRQYNSPLVNILGFNMDTIKDRYDFNNNEYEGFTNLKRKFIIQSNRYIWNVTDHIFEYNPYCYKDNTALFVKKRGRISPANIHNVLHEYTNNKVDLINNKLKYSIYKFIHPYKWYFFYDKKYNLDTLSNVLSFNTETIKRMFNCNDGYIPSSIPSLSSINSKNFLKTEIQEFSQSDSIPGVWLSGKYTIYIGNYIAPKHRRSLNYEKKHRTKKYIIGEPIIMLKIYGIVVMDTITDFLKVKILKDSSTVKYL